MTPHLLFIIFVSILVLNFLLEQTANYLNSKHFNDPVPEDLKEVYTTEKYKKSQQ